MTTVLTDVVDDADILQNRRVVDMDPVIKQLEPDEAPFTVMLSRVSSRPAKSQKVEWLSDELVPRFTVLNNGGPFGTGAASFTVATGTGAYFRPGDILRMISGENVRVDSVVGDTVTVTRGLAGFTPVSIADATDVIKIGNASAEGASLGTIKMTQQVANYNYCQIQRDPLGFTNTLINSDLYGGSEPAYEAKKKMIEHRRQIENTLFFGQRDLGSVLGAPIGYCGGLVDYIKTNITSLTAPNTLTEEIFEQFIRESFRYGSRNKVLFASPLIVSALSSFPQSKLAPDSTGPSVKDYGVSLQRYMGSSGESVQIVVKRDWQDFDQTTSDGIGTWAFLVDMDDVTMRPLRKTVMLPNRQAPDEDSVKQEYLTEYSLQIGIEKNHAILKGVTNYA